MSFHPYHWRMSNAVTTSIFQGFIGGLVASIAAVLAAVLSGVFDSDLFQRRARDVAAGGFMEVASDARCKAMDAADSTYKLEAAFYRIVACAESEEEVRAAEQLRLMLHAWTKGYPHSFEDMVSDLKAGLGEGIVERNLAALREIHAACKKEDGKELGRISNKLMLSFAAEWRR